jgi:hypothetical protein
MATSAQEIGPLNLDGSQRRQQVLGPQLHVLRLLPADASQPSLVHARWIVMQQLTESCGTCAVQDGPDRHLDGFQIDTATAAPLGKYLLEQAIYFARDFPMDCKTRFFSCAVQPAASDSTGTL